jgi:hypothetical protein
MSKILAVMIAGLFASAAFAQNPPGTSSEQAPVLNSKSQDKAQNKVEARPQGMVKAPGGDESKNSEINAVQNSKGTEKAQSKVEARPQGMVKQPMGDESKNSEINAVQNTKSTEAGQAKIATRNAKAAAKKQGTMAPAPAAN